MYIGVHAVMNRNKYTHTHICAQTHGVQPARIIDITRDIDKDFEDGCTYYHVQYEDGDEEDMNENECRAAIDLYNKLDSGEINEWEIGDE